MTQASQDCIAFIKQWEEFVPYPYDDKLPKVRIGKAFCYPVWRGGKSRGTITIGYGHTNKAGLPLITPRMVITEPHACEILAADLAPVERLVQHFVRGAVAQHQYDALVSLAYNCPSAIPHVASLINAGDLAAVPATMLKYTYSGGEYMLGLLHRRQGEVALWNSH